MKKALFFISCAATLIGQAQAADAPKKFSCTGSLIAPRGQNPVTKTVQFAFDPATTASVIVDEKTITAPITSNNVTTLKFANTQAEASFFYYTNELFISYASGHLARLTCKPVE